MENASKALLMAGEVLISIIIINALLLMFNSLTSYQSVKEQNTKETQVIAFNNTYEAYNTKDVRGNDLYSLINRVVDYNKRKSTEGKEDDDEGQYINYQPMTIKVSLKAKNGKDQNEFRYDKEQRIFTTGSEFVINSTNNTFDDFFKKIRNPEKYTEEKLNSEQLNNLVMGLTKIFISEEDFKYYCEKDLPKAQQIIYNFNSACGRKVLKADEDKIKESWKAIREGSKIREMVYTYYEYLQFTRAHFDCTKVEYNEGTGRIVSMEFEFNGKIN